MRAPRIHAVAIALLLCTGCGAGEEPESVPARPPPRDEFVRTGLLPSASTRGGLASAFGEPDSVRSAEVPNRHVPGVTDTLFAIHYPGLVLQTHKPGGADEIVASVEVRDNRFLSFPMIGVRRGEVESAFGAPQEVRDGRHVYLCGECMGAENPLELVFAGDRVERVRFTYYVD